MLARVAPRRGRSDGNVTQKFACFPFVRCVTQGSRPAPRGSRKRKHVGRPFFFAKRFVHPGDLRVAHQGNRDAGFLETEFPLQAAQKEFKWTPRQSHGSLLVQNHPCWIYFSSSFPDSRAWVPALP